MNGGTPDRRVDLLAEGLRTAARLARWRAQPHLSEEVASSAEQAAGARALATFADEIDAVAFRLEELAAGVVSHHR